MSNAQDKMLGAVKRLSKSRKTVTLVDGVEVDIYACQVRHLPSLVYAVESVFKELGVTDIAGATEAATDIAGSLNNPQRLLQLIAKFTHEVSEIGTTLCSLDDEDFQELEIDDFLKVLIAEVEVNRDFFMQRVKPLLAPMLNSLRNETASTEASPSSTQ
jgi:hypothetical protein